MNIKETVKADAGVNMMANAEESTRANMTANAIINTTVNLAGVELKNPVMTASGTFGSGQEYGELIDLNRLGADKLKV